MAAETLTAEQELQAVKDARDEAAAELVAAEREYQDLLTRARAGDRSVESLLAGIGGRLLFARTALEGAEAAVPVAEEKFMWRVDAERQAALLTEFGSNAEFEARMQALSATARDALEELATETWKRNTAVMELNTSMRRHMAIAQVEQHPMVANSAWLRDYDLTAAALAVLSQAQDPVRKASVVYINGSPWSSTRVFEKLTDGKTVPENGGPFKLQPKP